MFTDALFSPFLTAAAALIVNALLGVALYLLGLRCDPVAPFRRVAAWLERRLNRAERSEQDRVVRGWLVVAPAILASMAIGFLVDALLASHRLGNVFEIGLIALVIGQQDVFDRVRAVGRLLRSADGLPVQRQQAAAALQRPTADLDEFGIARTAIEEAALRFSLEVVTPAFWYLLLGLSGFFAAVAAGAVYRALGSRAAFGKAARQAEAVIAFVPARLAGPMLAVASVGVPRARPDATVAAMMKRYAGLRSINAGWPLGAVAGGLDLALAGPARREPWVGSGRARASVVDVDRMLMLYAIACAILAVLIAAAGLAFALLAN